MRNCFRYLLYLVVAACFSSANAGSYEDFFIAVKQDNTRLMLGLLLRGFDPNTLDPKGYHGLYLALREPSPRIADLLIELQQTKIDERSPQDETPLMMAALKGELAFCRRLIARDADVNKTGWTPLHYAATGGHVAVIELLLEHHAYIDAESPNGTTPLMMAARYGSEAAVKALLEAGADPSLKNQLGLSAADFARDGNRPGAAALIGKALTAPR